jgi:hypothetical protein
LFWPRSPMISASIAAGKCEAHLHDAHPRSPAWTRIQMEVRAAISRLYELLGSRFKLKADAAQSGPTLGRELFLHQRAFERESPRALACHGAIASTSSARCSRGSLIACILILPCSKFHILGPSGSRELLVLLLLVSVQKTCAGQGHCDLACCAR